MEIKYLKEFLVLAEVGNFLEAADQLYLSQSSLSRHIKSMEEELGTPLLVRSRKLSLTDFGERFLPYAQRIVKLQEDYQRELFEYKKSIQGTLSIGSIPSMTQYQILDMLEDFKTQNPACDLNLLEADSLQLVQMVEEDQIELAFVRSDGSISEQIEQIEFARDVLVAAVSVQHPLSGRESIRLEELAGETLLLLSRDTYMHQFCVRSCRAAGFEPTIGYTGHRGENLLAMASRGNGVVLLTRKPMESVRNDQVKILEICPELTTSVCLIYKKEKKLSAFAREMVQMAKSNQ